jgi:hypothetical protein
MGFSSTRIFAPLLDVYNTLKLNMFTWCLMSA